MPATKNERDDRTKALLLTAALAAFTVPAHSRSAQAQPAPRRHQSDRPDCTAQLDALPARWTVKISIWAARLADVMPTTCNSRMSVAAIRQLRGRAD